MLGMLAMMISITALFGTIVIAFMVRSQTRAHWNTVALPASLWVSTGLIVASSLTLEFARRAFGRFKAEAYGSWLALTFFLGLGFLLSQAWALRALVNEGVYLRQNPHSSLFYVITGTHGVHLLGGMMALFYLIYRVSRGASAPPLRFPKPAQPVSRDNGVLAFPGSIVDWLVPAAVVLEVD